MIEKMNGANEVLKKIRANKGGIHISRVPEKIKKQFIQLANDEFCGDYGMLITFFMKGVVNPETQMILDNMNDLNERVSYLESSLNNSEEQTKSIKLTNGKEIKKRK